MREKIEAVVIIVTLKTLRKLALDYQLKSLVKILKKRNTKVSHRSHGSYIVAKKS